MSWDSDAYPGYHRVGQPFLMVRFPPLARNTKRRLLFYGSLLLATAFAGAYSGIMPGHSFSGHLPPLDARELRYESFVQQDVATLAGAIGERNTMRAERLQAAADYIEFALHQAGYHVQKHPYTVDNVTCETLDADLQGTVAPREIVLVGAHYDSAGSAPGADDNASGSAGVLALARSFAGRHQKRTIRFALFPNEEPPYFASDAMGSLVYARELKARGDDIVTMLNLESIGFFAEGAKTQHYPGIVFPLYPTRGDFIAFVGDIGSRGLVHDAIGVFRASAHIPSEGAVLPARIPGVDWSDHRSFRAMGYPAIMVTDTALFRNPNYHTANDKPETLDYARLARVLSGLEDVVTALAGQ